MASGTIISLLVPVPVPALPSVSVKSFSLPDDPTVSMLFNGFSPHCQQYFKTLNDKRPSVGLRKTHRTGRKKERRKNWKKIRTMK
jgi:hypothetical protein